MTIDYLKYQQQLKVKYENEVAKIWCVVRKKWLVNTPEEMVRQLVLLFFIKEDIYPTSLISVERALTVNGMTKRFDILIYNHQGNPFLLVECKRPEVKITDKVFIQVSNYNQEFKVPYLMVTNGISTYFCSINYEKKSYYYTENIPNWNKAEQ